jgi:hypothetical protein
LLNFLEKYIYVDSYLNSSNTYNLNTLDNSYNKTHGNEYVNGNGNEYVNEYVNGNVNEKENEYGKEKETELIKRKGKDNLLNYLVKLIPDSDMNKINENENHVKIFKNNKPDILIDYNEYLNKNLSKEDLDKFYNNVNKNNCCGILCNNSGIANRENFQIDIENDNIYIFISNYTINNNNNENNRNDINDNLLLLAIKIIYHVHSIIKERSCGTIEIDKELFQRLKLEYNYFLTTYNLHINSIKNNVIALEKLALVQLEHFFKRTHINSNDKPYSCQLCGTKFGSDKSLKSHLKLKHDIKITKDRKKKNKEKDNEDLLEENAEDNKDDNHEIDGKIVFL